VGDARAIGLRIGAGRRGFARLCIARNEHDVADASADRRRESEPDLRFDRDSDREPYGDTDRGADVGGTDHSSADDRGAHRGGEPDASTNTVAGRGREPVNSRERISSAGREWRQLRLPVDRRARWPWRPDRYRDHGRAQTAAIDTEDPMKSQKDRRAPNRRPDSAPKAQDPQGGQPGKKRGSQGGAGAQSGAGGHQGKNSPK
jgi:hypothetical protein